MIKIRTYQPEDAQTLWHLFFNTIRQVNLQDYTQAQVEAWASEDINMKDWIAHLNQLCPYIAEINHKIVGYADLQPDGLIDHFFCHHQYQGCGVGRALMSHIHIQAKKQHLTRLYANVSVTAKPFFEHAGFVVKEPQSVSLRGQSFINYKMEKIIT
ncbi:GNAT family N-acetyltransferase [Vibrio rumoiensis]|uniref:GNAT family N-acetyltransferase n=1 Tax=Vibrio rumoiensis TaxID=76258 RepID=UPI000B5C5653|nr:GNAT family N-acetyltransferase [Vibrio rumoiensis]